MNVLDLRDQLNKYLENHDGSQQVLIENKDLMATRISEVDEVLYQLDGQIGMFDVFDYTLDYWDIPVEFGDAEDGFLITPEDVYIKEKQPQKLDF